MVAAVTTECGTDASVDCVPLWRSASPSRELRRARFLEWPLAAAVVLGFVDRDAAREARDTLRSRAHDEGSRIAVVFDGDDLSGPRDEVIDAVRASAARAQALARRGQRLRMAEGNVHVLDVLAAAPAPVPWLRLDTEEVLVVPKLGALSDVEAFASEVERGLPKAGRVEWVRRPDPIR
jgi:hypothetical protein